ncbi:MAG TPA: transcription-repair coupling factor, partial [Verrucomicrobiae bacterium]|nr:transcription-repair coupling factor [Verrucomicrobiae bacterium]
DRVLSTPAAQSLARRLESGGALSFAGITASAQPFFAALLHRLFPQRPIVVVTDSLKSQESFHQDLETWLDQTTNTERGTRSEDVGQSSILNSPSSPLFYPAWEILPHEGKLPHADIIAERLETLVALGNNAERGARNAELVVTSASALLQKTFPPAELKLQTRKLQRGDQANLLDLIEWLEEQGYEPEAQVTHKGEIAMRGGIVDLFPPTSPWPVRLEFFGDELESLREFDPLSQVSRGEIPSITVPPAGELGILKQLVGTHSTASEASGKIGDAVEHVPTGSLATLLDYLPNKTILLLCGPEQIELRAEEYAGQVPADDPFFVGWEEFLAELSQRGMTRIDLSDESVAPGETSEETERTLVFDSLDAFRPLGERAPDPQIAETQRREFFNQLHRWLRQDYAVHVFCNNAGERERFFEVWKEFGFDTPIHPAIGALARGFLCEEAKLVVVTDAEIFGRYKVQRPRRLKSPHASAMRSALEIDFADLEEGDLVVHLQHGIGRYLGLKNLPAGSGTRGRDPSMVSSQSATECLVIEFAPADYDQEPPKLYVPVTESHLVSKYVGAGKVRPPLNTLGGTRWKKAVEQTERAVRDVAAELLRIQAARESQPGHAFPSDVTWQREFEGSFIYEETPDQLRAIGETKSDMERAKPMDRLICGDVGFGKTEVAIRAAFKAVMGGKQVAVLVPTTVLAQQHFNNFRERMADYPVKVELLSRFRSRREQQRVVKDLAAGAVDIVIGTHRLIQEDITFKELGLVVIDEEQRFGVLHKEKFKRLRTLVDVLTLSATPIPRTLYLALTGARDMSTIQTPPHDRLPVETIVTQYDERTIRDAIQRELNRGGQVFFLHNRVATILTMQQTLQNLVPNARIVVGHGQMHADELEEVMTKFVNGEADVLLSTTIIESGLDIPNANTIIIDRADRFGLSDLYQLRGRVGRYKHQAYAYLLLPRHARLLTDVRKRISAMKQYSTLGSGFKIAMRDLEIRGAGNLLGAEQSGHITAVGFELYCQLLKQSVGSLKGEKVKPRVEVRVALDFLGDAASLPERYVPESHHRIEVYRKLAQATDKTALDALQRELRDRFGPIPPAVELLLAVGELKILASEKNVTVIEVKEDKLMLTRHNDFITLGGKFPRLTKKDTNARLKEIKKLLLAI